MIRSSTTVSRPNAKATVLLAAGLAAAASAAVIVLAGHVSAPPVAGARVVTTDSYEPHQLLVTLKHGTNGSAAAAYIRRSTGVNVSVSAKNSGDPAQALLQVPHGVPVAALQNRVDGLLQQARASAAAAPPISGTTLNYIARVAGAIPRDGKRFVPNDEGNVNKPGGWQFKQWNFKPRAGVSAPGAWGNLLADGRAGARGVTIAVIDTGVAFENWRQFRASPDFSSTKFVDPCDVVAGRVTPQGTCTDPHAVDEDGHGTFVAGEIAESTNNRLGLTGLAYRANIMPIRALGNQGHGSETTVATGIRYAVDHGAQVINLSIEFAGVNSRDIPGVIAAIAYARSKNVVVVGAAGNEGTRGLDYPAADRQVISVGATTYDQCLAQYSNFGSALDLVAPGGSDDASLKQRNCHPNRNQPPVYQMDFSNRPGPQSFGLVPMFGTSMAAPEVSAAAAMVIASGAVGAKPTAAQVQDRLEATARRLDGSKRNAHYGYGLLDIWQATRRGGPKRP